MEGLSPHRFPARFRRAASALVIAVCALLGVVAGDSIARAEDYRDACDSSRTSWSIEADQTRIQVSKHTRDFYERHSGTAAERIQLSTTIGDAVAVLTHRVPLSLVHDELTASLWVRANRSGAVISMRIRLPHQVDPSTGEAMTFEIRGDTYKETHRWQQLTVNSTSQEVERQMMLLRGRVANVLDGRILDTRDGHVDRVSIELATTKGVFEILIDDLQYGPLVRLPAEPNSIQQIKLDQRERKECPAQVSPNRLLVNRKPFFPRITSYQGENLDTLASMGINVVWIERYDDQILLDELAQRGIWAMAAPPQLPMSPDGSLLASAESGLMPIPASTAPILFWTVGTRIPADQLRNVEQWISQVEAADRAFTRPRPIIADVISRERAFSRHLSLIGHSRHILHTTFAPSQYRDYLSYKKNLALPDCFNWTWIQTEPAAPNLATRQASRHEPIVVEAEQIWMQAWTAISVGHRAIGFWKTGSLDEDSPAAHERRLAISLLNAQIDLLEPLLATGQVVDTVPVEVGAKETSNRRSRGLRGRAESSGGNSSSAEQRPDVRASVIQSKFGQVIIPIWYDRHAQFQPGQMAGSDVRFLVRGGGTHAFAWSVTTTSVHPLELEYPAGGMEIRLPMIDQHAFVVVTSDPEFGSKLTQRMRSQRKRAAQMWVELARIRLERVQETHQQLERLARTKVANAPALLTQATQLVEQAEAQLQAGQFDHVRRMSRSSMQLMRILQRTHWENAVAGMTSPTSSPHTICFSTLPDHWRMINAIGSNSGSSGENRLRSGDFEDLDTVVADGWQPQIDPGVEGDIRLAELHPHAVEGKYCLRIVSKSIDTQTSVGGASRARVTLISPAVPVDGGQIVVISGQLRIEEQVNGHPDGLMISDNVKGTVGALRFWRESPAGEWERFRIIREVTHSRDIQLTIELNGDGEVWFDDIRIVSLSPPRLASGVRPANPAKNPRRNLLDFAPSLPKVPFWPGRKSKEPTNAPQ